LIELTPPIPPAPAGPSYRFRESRDTRLGRRVGDLGGVAHRPAVEVILIMRPLVCRTIDVAAARVIRNTRHTHRRSVQPFEFCDG